MSTAIKTVDFSSADINEQEIWVKMEQEVIPETSLDANLFDIFQMINRSASGLTSFSYVPTSLDYVMFTPTTIEIKLDFWVFPSNMDLLYSMTINQGSLSSRIHDSVPKVGNIVIPLDDKVQMPYLIDPVVSSFGWESPVYDDLGHLLDSPDITVNGPYLTFTQDVFGIVRANIMAQGYKYTATLSFPKSQTGRAEIFGIIANQTSYTSITNVRCSVICTYIDENGEEQEEMLELKIPKPVLDFLAECDDGYPTLWPRCAGSILDTEENQTYSTTIYYSTCTGEILDTVRSDLGGTGCDNE